MLKQVGSAALAFVVITAPSLGFAQQPRPGKPAAKPATTRAIVVQESDEKATPTSPAAAPATEDKVLAKPVAPGVPVGKPADAGPPPVAEKPPPSGEKSLRLLRRHLLARNLLRRHLLARSLPFS